MRFSWKNPLSALPVLLLLAAHTGTAWGLAGNVQFVIGDVKLINPAGQAKALQKGAEINEGDRIVTGEGASAQIKMVDGGFIAVRPNTDIGFDTYRYGGKEDGTENAVVSLVQGGFRTITGIIGRTNKQNYTIKTATSTIGIRGTDHEPMVILAPKPGQVAIAPPGTYDKVNLGVAFIRNEAGTIDIQRNQVGYAPDAKSIPRVLPSIPPFFKPTPPPGPQKAKEDEGKKDEGQKSASGEIRDTAVVDPTSSAGAAPATGITVTPAVAPVVAIVASDASGKTLNATTLQTTACPTCATTLVNQPAPSSGPTSTPSPGLVPAVSITGGTGNFRQFVYLPQTTSKIGASTGSSTYNSVYSLAAGVVQGASNYLFDASGNLASILGSDYRLSDRGVSTPPSYASGVLPYTGTPGGLPSSPLTGVLVSFSGGTTPDSNYNDTVNGIRLGRYAGGAVTTTDSSNPANVQSFVTQLGNNSLVWAVRELPGSVPITGSVEYTRAYATSPNDSRGNAGTLNYASLAANFTNQTVSPAVGITINNQNLSAAATNVPLDKSFGFDVSSGAAQNLNGGGALKVTCFGSNCAPPPVGLSSAYGGYGGRIVGGLAGATGTAGGAYFRYNFDTYYNPLVAAGVTGGIPSGETRPVNDYINGVVGFTKGADVGAPATGAAGFQSISASYFRLPAGSTASSPWAQDYYASPADFTNPFGVASTNKVADYDPTGTRPHSETLTGGTVAQAATNADSFAATGVSFGRYTGGTVAGSDFSGNAFSYTNKGSYAWIMGPSTPFGIRALGGTAMYKFDGGTPPVNDAGSSASAGTVKSAVLAVDFNRSAVGIDLSVATKSESWTASSTPGGALTGNPSTSIRLNGASFFGSVNAPAPLHESLYVSHNGGTANAAGVSGFVAGALMGGNLNGAGMTYAFQDDSTTPPGFGINGAVAFALNSYSSTPATINATGSAVATPTTTLGTSAIDMSSLPYQIRLGTSGLNANPSAIPANAPASVDGAYLTHVAGLASSTSRSNFGADGMTTKWDSLTGVTACTATPCTASTAFVRAIPIQISIESASFGTGAGQVALPAGKSVATVLESGIDAATGMRWGRYGGGVAAITDRITGAVSTADLSTQNLHAILGPTQTGPTVLPTTGTFSYSNVGGTHPTDNLGSAAGTLNAATLVADFAKQTVNAGVNVTVNGQTWSAGASTIPIQQMRSFEASRTQSGSGNLNINVCSGAGCSTTITIPTASSAGTSGRVLGAFNGTSGQGAGVVYSLNQGNVTGTTVSGVAAFKR